MAGGKANRSNVIKKKDIDPDKVKTAVALGYEPSEGAPKILAAGKGAVAQRIVEKAKDADIPFYRDSSLADTLSSLEIGDMIPVELYDVVAEILVFVDEMDRIKSKLDGR